MQGFGQFEAINLDAFERFLEVELADDLAQDPIGPEQEAG
jgi:hypothetical protein